jgi:nitrate/nitrite transport system permease protein
MNGRAQPLIAGMLTVLFLAVFLGIWHLATLPKKEVAGAQDEYAKLMGKGTKKSDGFPTLGQLGDAALTQLKDPLYDRGANDKRCRSAS